MEIFLLLLDELDDAAATLRALLPRLLGFLLACAGFTLSILMAMRWPMMAAFVLLMALLLALLFATVPARRFKPLFRFKTGP